MACAVPLRADFTAADLRHLARHADDAKQTRRLLALATIYDGGSRRDAARVGGVGPQIIRDWVVRFNSDGPEGLINLHAPGQPPLLNDAQRRALVALVDSGPIPAVHGAHAVLLMDQAGWHLSHHLIVPPTVTILPLPAKCPELNPVEKVWQFMRDNWLSNRVFQSCDAIVDHCCEAWNKPTDQPWLIMSIGMRDWAYRS